MEFNERVLNRAHDELVSKLDPLPLIQVFEETEYLPSSDIKDIQKLTTKRMKNRIILNKVSGLGVNGYELFKQYLGKSNQPDLVKYLEQKEMEIRQQIGRQGRPAQLPVQVSAPYGWGRVSVDGSSQKFGQPSVGPNGAASSASKSAMRNLNRDQIKLIQKCCHDGQLVTLDSDHVDEIKNLCDDKDINRTGGFGTVYITREPVEGYQIKVVLKEIKVEESDKMKKMHSITNEKLASRIMHFAIVPLLAYREDTANRVYHFVSPYLEGGDLYHAIQQHNSETSTYTIDMKERLRILFQIACAIEYLHTEVDNFRNAVVHMDIKTPNIVLDEKKNARLIDFGLAREMSETENDTSSTSTSIFLTPGYFPVKDYKSLTPKHDCYNFGVVIRELLTGLKPTVTDGNDNMLRGWTERQVLEKVDQKDLWTESAAEALAKLSKGCIDCIDPKQVEPFTSKLIKNHLKEFIRSKIPVFQKWLRSHQRANLCEICMVNPKGDETLTQHPNCPGIQVCVACMRNSYLNPIMCPNCDKKVDPHIGCDWAALMVAGNDTNTDAAKMFHKDITELKDVLVSKSLPVMCLKEEMVQIVVPKTPGIDDSSDLLKRMDTAIENLIKKKPKVLIFVYSGHHSNAGFRLGPIDTENTNLKDGDLCSRLLKFKTVKKYMVFEDCCNSTIFTELKTVNGSALWQLNGCGSNGESYVRTTTGSVFMKYLIQAFTKEALQKKCYNEEEFQDHMCQTCQIDGELITASKLLTYVSDHVKFYRSQVYDTDDFKPQSDSLGVEDGDLVVAYKYDFVVEIKLTLAWIKPPGNNSLSLKPKKDYTTFADLKRLLFKDFCTNCVSESAYEKLDSYDDIICIEVSMGPKQKHRQEITTLEKLNAAWNAKREFVVSCRRIENLCQGRVLFSVPDANFVCRCLQENTSLQIVKTDETGGTPVRKTQISGNGFDEVIRNLGYLAQNSYLKSFVDALDRLHSDLEKQVKDGWDVLVSFPLDCCTGTFREQFICLELQRESNEEG